MGRPCGQLVGCSVFASSASNQSIFAGFERHVDLDGGVAGDGGGDAGAAGLFVFRLLLAFGHGKHLFQHAFELAAFKADGRGLYGQGARAKGLGLKAVALQLFGDGGEGDHLLGQQLDQHGHEQALALDMLDVALAQDFFEQDALVGDVLVDDPEAFFVDGEDEGVAQLAQGLEGGEGVEGRLGLVAAAFEASDALRRSS